VDGCAADGLDDPGRQIGEVPRDAPVTGGRSHVFPGKLGEAFPFVVDEIIHLVTGARLEDDGLDSFAREFGAERTAARAGADDDN